ncbi:hypothetical protein AALP_AA4G077600 [Arabis alpina]|uniref:Uncharacterized protein n=1 Tax=Arabis alpina TaxID=50452 RepID=A0A087H1V1_ARAAL|nr:hypothetical protein AALP_AA4G077600 [Arabis alpina]
MLHTLATILLLNGTTSSFAGLTKFHLKNRFPPPSATLVREKISTVSIKSSPPGRILRKLAGEAHRLSCYSSPVVSAEMCCVRLTSDLSSASSQPPIVILSKLQERAQPPEPPDPPVPPYPQLSTCFALHHGSSPPWPINLRFQSGEIGGFAEIIKLYPLIGDSREKLRRSFDHFFSRLKLVRIFISLMSCNHSFPPPSILTPVSSPPCKIQEFWARPIQFLGLGLFGGPSLKPSTTTNLCFVY